MDWRGSFLLLFGERLSPDKEKLFLIQFFNNIERQALAVVQLVRLRISEGVAQYNEAAEAFFKEIFGHTEKKRQEIESFLEEGYCLVGRFFDRSGIRESERGGVAYVHFGRNRTFLPIAIQYKGEGWDLCMVRGDKESLLFARPRPGKDEAGDPKSCREEIK